MMCVEFGIITLVVSISSKTGVQIRHDSRSSSLRTNIPLNFNLEEIIWESSEDLRSWPQCLKDQPRVGIRVVYVAISLLVAQIKLRGHRLCAEPRGLGVAFEVDCFIWLYSEDKLIL